MKENTLKKIIMASFLGIVIIYQLYNILCNTRVYVTPDMASTVLLANEQINTHQLFPEGFYHSTGVFTIHLNLLIIPFMLFIKDWLLCRELAVIVQTIIGVTCIFILFRKIVRNGTWKFCGALATLLILLPLTYNVTYYGFYEAVYFLNLIFELFILISFLKLQDSKKTVPAVFLYLFAIIITNLNNTKVVVHVVIPILMTILLFTFIESGLSLRKMFLTKKWIYTLAFSILGIGIAFILFHFISVKVGLVSAVGGNTFSPLDQIGENILKLINSLFAVYGASGVSAIISYSGFMHAIKLIYALICLLIVPIYAVVSYKNVDNANIRFMIIYLIVSNLLTIYMCIFTTVAGGVRYLLPVYFNNIILLVLCIQISKEVQKYKFEVWCTAGIFALLVIGVWEVQIVGGNLFVDESILIDDSSAIVKLMKEKEITYGYADFSDAYGNMMLSNGEITMAAFVGSDLSPYYWLTSEKYYMEENYEGRHCILIKNTANIDEIYYICADEIIHQGKYILLIYDNCIIRDLKEKKNDIIPEWEIAISSLGITDMAYRYQNCIYLKRDGMQFGPYIELKAGKYVVEITGQFMKSAVPSVYAGNGLENIDINILEYDDEFLKYSFTLNDDKEGVELILRNNSDDIVEISEIRYAKRSGDDVNQLLFKQIELPELSIGDNALNSGTYIELEQGGMQFGPYMNLEAGTYEIEITGRNLSCGQANVLAQDGQETINIEVKESNNDKVVYTFQIANSKERVEFTFRNMYDTMIHIYSVGYRKMD